MIIQVLMKHSVLLMYCLGSKDYFTAQTKDVLDLFFQ